MDRLPDELLCCIFKYAMEDIRQLLTLQIVCKRFHRYVSNHGFLWYYAYKIMYPRWSFDVGYTHHKQPLVNWKEHMMRLYRQKCYLRTGLRLQPLLAPSTSYKIQEPFISDIDPITQTGVLAVSKYCRFTRHKILFYHYPSYRLLRKFELKFQIDDTMEWSCQIIGMQTLQIPGQGKVRLFALSLNQPLPILDSDEEDEEENSGSRTLWKNILIYRLHVDGTTTCLANLKATDLFLGRGTWFFNDMHKRKDWLHIISPTTLQKISTQTVFMLAYGISRNTFAGHSEIIQFDLSDNQSNDRMDPTKTVHRWDDDSDAFLSTNAPCNQGNGRHSNEAKVISTFYLGARVSCMIQLAAPLSHLICTGNFLRNELAIYDWRFGIKVGVFMHPVGEHSAQPWGFEAGWAITPPLGKANEYDMYGPRLIVVGDDGDKFQIKIWDISKLFKVTWNPFFDDDEKETENETRRVHHPWWERKTDMLRKVALAEESELPYTVSTDAVQCVHLLDAHIKFTAYINLNTWLYLLHEDGHLTVMDIESGEILNTIYTGGIADDVNLIGSSQVIVTRKERLLSTTGLP